MDQEQFFDISRALRDISDAEEGRNKASDVKRPNLQEPARPVPHYVARTSVTVDWCFVHLFRASMVINAAYFILRIVYIAIGRIKVELPSDLSSDEALQRQAMQNRAALVYSIIVLVAEFGGFLLVHIGQQMFRRQKTEWKPMEDPNIQRMRQVVAEKGPLQVIHVIVCTYSEDAETVEACVQHLLNSPIPVYAARTIWVADDGHTKPQGEGKRQFVARMRADGHSVEYVGDRVRKPWQLNGKSSNLNHVILSKIYPNVQSSRDVPWRDILVVMDCDHLVKRSFFHKTCAVMLADQQNAVVLTPQAFHNLVQPDFFDNSNTNFMFRLMPYYFGAGCCFITGTNVMLRARACFEACRFGVEKKRSRWWRRRRAPGTLTAGADRRRQLFSEVLVAEDVDLGSRIHALGYKSVFLDEVLARGEVPQGPRDFWKQRSRWAKASHLYILDWGSVFWRNQEYMDGYQKMLYCVPLILHFTLFFTEPVMYTLPLICTCFSICPYGVDFWLWLTHFLRLAITFIVSTHGRDVKQRMAGINALTSSRILYFVNVKAVLNTLMVIFRYKYPGKFKVTKKASAASESAPEAVAEGAGGAIWQPTILCNVNEEEDDSWALTRAVSGTHPLHKHAGAGLSAQTADATSNEALPAIKVVPNRPANPVYYQGMRAAPPELDPTSPGPLSPYLRDPFIFGDGLQSSTPETRSPFIQRKWVRSVNPTVHSPGSSAQSLDDSPSSRAWGKKAVPLLANRDRPMLEAQSGPTVDMHDISARAAASEAAKEEQAAEEAAKKEQAAEEATENEQAAQQAATAQAAASCSRPASSAGGSEAGEAARGKEGQAVSCSDGRSKLHEASVPVATPVNNDTVFSNPCPPTAWTPRDSEQPGGQGTQDLHPLAIEILGPSAVMPEMPTDPTGTPVSPCIELPTELDDALQFSASTLRDGATDTHRMLQGSMLPLSSIAGAAQGSSQSSVLASSRRSGGSREVDMPANPVPDEMRMPRSPGPRAMQAASAIDASNAPPSVPQVSRTPSPAPPTPVRSTGAPEWTGQHAVHSRPMSQATTLASGSRTQSSSGAVPSMLHLDFSILDAIPLGQDSRHNSSNEQSGAGGQLLNGGRSSSANGPQHLPLAEVLDLKSRHLSLKSRAQRVMSLPVGAERHGQCMASTPLIQTLAHDRDGLRSSGVARFGPGGLPAQQHSTHYTPPPQELQPVQLSSGNGGATPPLRQSTPLQDRSARHSVSPSLASESDVAGAQADEAEPNRGWGLYYIHDELSRVSEIRKPYLPYEGTLDFWVLLVITGINLAAVIYGAVDISRSGRLFSFRGTEDENVRLIAVVFGLVEAAPGLMFMWYMAVYRCCPWTLWIWIPSILFVVSALVVFIEARVGVQYMSALFGYDWGQ